MIAGGARSPVCRSTRAGGPCRWPTTPARAFQVMFVLRELRAAVHFCALTLSGVTPSRRTCSQGPRVRRVHGLAAAVSRGCRGQAERYNEVEDQTNRRMGEIIGAALTSDEADELAWLSTAALAAMSWAPHPAGVADAPPATSMPRRSATKMPWCSGNDFR